MGAYTLELKRPRCFCGKMASLEVFNTFNASCGTFCTYHAKRRLAELERATRNDDRVHLNNGEVR
jgi:hypothetical protein